MEMQQSIRKFKVTHYLSALLLVAAGVILVIWPEMTLTTICMVIGGIVAAVGVFYIIAYFVRDRLKSILGMDLVLGLLITAVGILILTHTKTVISMIPVIFGVVLLISSLVKVQTAVDMKRLHVKRWWITLLFAVMTIILAVVLIRNPFEAMATLMVYVGICFIVDGILTLFSMIALGANLRRVKKLAERESKDADIIDAEEKPLEW
ncbi:MAG: DUF308 domain-containing protein [Lachnospiraceae bacterium]|nr:DUF308 domain-containing protein [Lachnospiraceae bacterium]